MDSVDSNSSTRSPSSTSQQSEASGAGENDYPPQRHAGAVGLGPNYGKGASGEDKIVGFKDEVKGKILRKPDLVQHGHDLRTGELKKKEIENEPNPFQPAQKPKGKGPTHPDEIEHVQAATTAPEGTNKAERQAEGENSDRVTNIG